VFFFPGLRAVGTVAALKRAKHRSQTPRPAERKSTPEASARLAGRPALSARRRWFFRLGAAVLLPLLLAAALEAGLRLAGYGYPTGFFLKTRISGQDVFVENERFGLRFFPANAARSPAPVVLPADKANNAYRIFLLGESAALGDPRPAYGVGRYVEVLLRERFPEAKFEVICVAMTAINSHAMLPIARECARHQGDCWIVYAGNNEMIGPFGANTVFGPQAPRLGLVRAGLALRTTRLGQWLASLAQRLLPARTSPELWSGLKMFMANQLLPTDPRRETVYENFRRNLEDLLEAGRRAGVHVILTSVGSNLKDCGPFASLHREGLSQVQKGQWEQLYQAGAAAGAAQRRGDARAFYTQAAGLDAQFAELQFRLGLCNLGLTNHAEALTNFALARDYDALPFRTDSRLNAIAAQTAARYAGTNVHWLDGAGLLGQHSPQGIPGQELFYEHVHLNFTGNYLLARAFAEEVAALLPRHLTASTRPHWLAQEACEQQLGLTDWNRYAVLEGVIGRLLDAPYTNQFNHVPRIKAYWTQLMEIKARLQPKNYNEARRVYEEAINRAPNDHRLHENYAEFLEASGNFAQAAAQWQKVRALLPCHFSSWYHLGRLLARQKQHAEADDCFAKALSLRPDLMEGHLEWGKALYSQGRLAEAMARGLEARRLRPDDPRVYFHLANVLAAQKKRTAALESLREAIRLQPFYWEARYCYGLELALDNKTQEALAEFEQVTRLRPDFALAHLNLGVALVKEGRLNDALAQFQETLRLEPNNRQAKEHLETVQEMTNQAH
jgi:tetratricopeptide (TPR) repeat protein